MTSRMRDYGVAALKRRPNVRFCRHQSCSPQWARAMDPIGRGARGQQDPVDLPLRLDDAAASPQLHRANISKHCLMETEKGAAAGPEDERGNEITRGQAAEP